MDQKKNILSCGLRLFFLIVIFLSMGAAQWFAFSVVNHWTIAWQFVLACLLMLVNVLVIILLPRQYYLKAQTSQTDKSVWIIVLVFTIGLLVMNINISFSGLWIDFYGEPIQASVAEKYTEIGHRNQLDYFIAYEYQVSHLTDGTNQYRGEEEILETEYDSFQLQDDIIIKYLSFDPSISALEMTDSDWDLELEAMLFTNLLANVLWFLVVPLSTRFDQAFKKNS